MTAGFDRDRALCAADPEAMFATDAESVAYNRTVCRRCPVQAGCRRWALDQREPWGMWGGLTPAEREAILGAGRRPMADRHLKPCGTSAAAARHRRNGERPCRPCLDAEARDHAERLARSAATAGREAA